MTLKEISKMSQNKRQNILKQDDSSEPKLTPNTTEQISESIFKNDNLKKEFIQYKKQIQASDDNINLNCYNYQNGNTDNLDLEMQYYWLNDDQFGDLNLNDLNSNNDNRYNNNIYSNELQHNDDAINESLEEGNSGTKRMLRSNHRTNECSNENVNQGKQIKKEENNYVVNEPAVCVKRKVGRPKGSTKKKNIDYNTQPRKVKYQKINNEYRCDDLKYSQNMYSNGQGIYQNNENASKEHNQNLSAKQQQNNIDYNNQIVNNPLNYETSDHYSNNYYETISKNNNVKRDYSNKMNIRQRKSHKVENKGYDDSPDNIAVKKQRYIQYQQHLNNKMKTDRDMDYNQYGNINYNHYKYGNNGNFAYDHHPQDSNNVYHNMNQNHIQNYGNYEYYYPNNQDANIYTISKNSEQYNQNAPGAMRYTDIFNSYANKNNSYYNSSMNPGYYHDVNSTMDLHGIRNSYNVKNQNKLKDHNPLLDTENFINNDLNNKSIYNSNMVENNQQDEYIKNNSTKSIDLQEPISDSENEKNSLNYVYKNIAAFQPSDNRKNTPEMSMKKGEKKYDVKQGKKSNQNNNKFKDHYSDSNNYYNTNLQIDSNLIENQDLQKFSTNFNEQISATNKCLENPDKCYDDYSIQNLKLNTLNSINDLNFFRNEDKKKAMIVKKELNNDASRNNETLKKDYFIRKIPVSHIKYAPDISINQSIEEFTLGLNNFNRFLSIEPLKEEFQFILYDIFIFSIKNCGFFSKTVEDNLTRLYTIESKFYKELYLKYLYPFEQFCMHKPVIYIFEKIKKNDNTLVDNIREKISSIRTTYKKNDKISTEMIVQVLKEGSIFDLLWILNFISNTVSERCVINELFFILRICHEKIHYKNIQCKTIKAKVNYIKTTDPDLRRFETLEKDKIFMIREQSLSIILNYIKGNVFETNTFKDIKNKIISRTVSLESFDIFAKYTDIVLLIKILYERSLEVTNACIQTTFLDSFNGFNIIYNKFGFLLKLDTIMFKFLKKFFLIEKLQVLTVIYQFEPSNNTKKKLNRILSVEFLQILNKFNESLKEQKNIENILMIDLIINFVFTINGYRSILADVSINIIKYKISKKKNEITSSLDQGLLDIFKCICNKKILAKIEDFDLLMRATTLKEYDDVIKKFILENE